jgi:chromosome segregation ATPase
LKEPPKDEDTSHLKSDLRTLEARNLQLKGSNRKLISTLEDQKNKIKTLQAALDELKSPKNGERLKNYDGLQKDYQRLKKEFYDLQERFNRSQRELVQLKKAVNKQKSGGLWGRLRNRASEDPEGKDVPENKAKK